MIHTQRTRRLALATTLLVLALPILMNGVGAERASDGNHDAILRKARSIAPLSTPRKRRPRRDTCPT